MNDLPIIQSGVVPLIHNGIAVVRNQNDGPTQQREYIYNLVAKWTGGVEFTTEEVS